MKKKDIVNAIFQNSDYYKQDIENVVDQVFELLAQGLESENKVNAMLLTGLFFIMGIILVYYGISILISWVLCKSNKRLLIKPFIFCCLLYIIHHKNVKNLKIVDKNLSIRFEIMFLLWYNMH